MNESDRFVFRILQSKVNDNWGYEIGVKTEGRVESLTWDCEYKTEREAEIAANAFIHGITFLESNIQ